MEQPAITIRRAGADDISLLVQFIRELAVYEKLEHEVVAEETALASHLFGTPQRCWAAIAERDGKPVGFTLYFFTYSTFLTRPSLYIEDIFVQPEQRGYGIGKALIGWLAQEALREDCHRMEWAVLDWNEPSRAFYHSLGAFHKEGWLPYQLSREALEKLAGTA